MFSPRANSSYKKLLLSYILKICNSEELQRGKATRNKLKYNFVVVVRHLLTLQNCMVKKYFYNDGNIKYMFVRCPCLIFHHEYPERHRAKCCGIWQGLGGSHGGWFPIAWFFPRAECNQLLCYMFSWLITHWSLRYSLDHSGSQTWWHSCHFLLGVSVPPSIDIDISVINAFQVATGRILHLFTGYT